MEVDDYFGPRILYVPHESPNYIPGKYKSEIYYYRQNFFSRKTGSYTRIIVNIRSRSNVLF